MKELTKAEEEVMQILWKIERGVVHDVLKYFEEPRPAYNTVSTIVRILEKKGFVDHKAYGKTYEYFPIISKEAYRKKFLSGFLGKYFENSYHSLVSHLAKEEKIGIKELEEVIKLIKEEEQNG